MNKIKSLETTTSADFLFKAPVCIPFDDTNIQKIAKFYSDILKYFLIDIKSEEAEGTTSFLYLKNRKELVNKWVSIASPEAYKQTINSLRIKAVLEAWEKLWRKDFFKNELIIRIKWCKDFMDTKRGNIEKIRKEKKNWILSPESSNVLRKNMDQYLDLLYLLDWLILLEENLSNHNYDSLMTIIINLITEYNTNIDKCNAFFKDAKDNNIEDKLSVDIAWYKGSKEIVEKFIIILGYRKEAMITFKEKEQQ